MKLSDEYLKGWADGKKEEQERFTNKLKDFLKKRFKMKDKYIEETITHCRGKTKQ